MLKNLVSRLRGTESQHPLAAKAGVAAILAGMPLGNPERALFDIDHWLAEAGHAAGEVEAGRLRQAVFQLDEAAAPVAAECLVRYLDPWGREHLAEQWWQTLVAHSERAAAGYLRLLREARREGEPSATERRQLAVAAARAMYWLMQGKKLLRLRYREQSQSSWGGVHELLGLAHGLGLAGQRLTLYEGVGETTVWHEYALGLYFELAPLGNLPPPQIEALDRILRPLAGHMGLKAEAPAAGHAASHAIDLAGAAGPLRLDAGLPAGREWRYLNTGPAHAQLLRLAAELRAGKALPEWLKAAPVSLTDVEALLKALLIAWSRQPPKRRHHRHTRHDELLVVHGFAIARRMVAFSDFARSGRSVAYRSDLALVLRERAEQQLPTDERERLAAARDEAAADPLAVLRSMELAGNRAMMEKWTLADISEAGLGATIAHLRQLHRIGGLVGYRIADELDWRLGIIRRLGRSPAGQAGIGLEALPGPSLCAQVKPLDKERECVWDRMAGSGLGFLDALLVAAETDELVLPQGAFVAGLPVLLRVGDAELPAVLGELVERGEDFDRVRFRPAD